MPEVRLYRATPASGLWRLADRDKGFGSPYWAYLWGGGLALARYVLDHPDYVAGRRVVDLGAGSGLVAIAAALAGAASVTAVDINPYALTAIRLNAAANGVAVQASLADFTELERIDADIVLAGDLFYDEALAAASLTWLERQHSTGVEALIGDPGRQHLPVERLELAALYPGPDFSDGANTSGNAVYALAPRQRG